MLGNEPAEIELYGPGEIMSGHEFYDYQAKYTPGLSETTATAEVTPVAAGHDPQARARHVPRDRRARASPGSTSCSRATTLVVSEINTIPGFTPISLFPVLCAEGGYDFAGGVPAGRGPRARARPRRATAAA